VLQNLVGSLPEVNLRLTVLQIPFTGSIPVSWQTSIITPSTSGVVNGRAWIVVGCAVLGLGGITGRRPSLSIIRLTPTGSISCHSDRQATINDAMPMTAPNTLKIVWSLF
jgi:hypothetical protein